MPRVRLARGAGTGAVGGRSCPGAFPRAVCPAPGRGSVPVSGVRASGLLELVLGRNSRALRWVGSVRVVHCLGAGEMLAF